MPEKLEDKDDAFLIRLACEGQEEAFGELVCRYQNSVYRLCLYYLREPEAAKDLTQEAFLKAFEARARFNASLDFRPWICRIGRNLCLNQLKRQKIIPMVSLDELTSPRTSDSKGQFGYEPSDQAPLPSEQMDKKERLTGMMEALESMDDPSRELIYFRYFNRLSAGEIARMTDSTEGAVRTRLHRALKRLHAVLAQEGDGSPV